MMKFCTSLIICISFITQLTAQHKLSFTLNGSINSDSGTMILLPVGDVSYYKNYGTTKEAKVINGKFVFKDLADYPISFLIGLKINREWQYISDIFFVEPTSQSIICNIDSSRKIPKVVNKTMLELENDFLASITQPGKKDVIIFNYIKKHPNSYVAMWKLIDAFGNSYWPLLDSCNANFSNTLKNSYTGKVLATKIALARKTAVGGTFPSLILFDTNNQKSNIPLRDNSNQFVFIDFWFSHCGPCISQFEALKNIYSKYQGKGFAMMGISVDTKVNEAAWKTLIVTHTLPWSQYWDVAGKEALKLNITHYPSNYLLDANSKIVAINLDTLQLEKWLMEKLK